MEDLALSVPGLLCGITVQIHQTDFVLFYFFLLNFQNFFSSSCLPAVAIFQQCFYAFNVVSFFPLNQNITKVKSCVWMAILKDN